MFKRRRPPNLSVTPNERLVPGSIVRFPTVRKPSDLRRLLVNSSSRMRGLLGNLCHRTLTLFVLALISVSSIAFRVLTTSWSVRALVASSPAVGTTQSTHSPEFHKTIEQEITSGETHSYPMMLNAGQYSRVVIESWGIEVSVTFRDSIGQNRAEFSCYPGGLIPISVIADVSGEYRFAVSARNGGTISGHYRVKLEDLRRATKRDREGILGENAFAQAERLRAEWRTESSYQAIKKYEEARSYWRTAGDRLAEAYALRSLGRVYQSLDEYEKAIAFYSQALALTQKLNDRRGEGDVLNDIGYIYFDFGDSQKALRTASLALKSSRVANNPRGEAHALHNIGEAYYGIGDLQKALWYLREALQLCQKSNDRQGEIRVLVSLGYTYIELSDVAKALDSHERALSMSRVANDRHGEVIALRALGNLQSKVGEKQQALNLFLKALEILQSLDARKLKATVVGGLGSIYDGVGEKQTAIKYYEEAISLFKETNDRWGEAEAERVIGEAHYSLGENRIALNHCQTALSLFRTLRMPRQEAKTLRDLGLIYAALGNKADALARYKQSLNLGRAGQDQRHEAYTLNYIGRLYESSGEKKVALNYYGRALPLSRVAADPSGESSTLYNIARVERDMGSLNAARARIEEAITIAESLRTKVASRNLQVTYFASAHQYHELYIDVLMRLHKETPGHGLDILAFAASERARARALMDMLEEAHADISQGVDPALLQRKRSLQRTLQGKTERQMRLLSGQYNKDEAAALAKEIREITTNYDDLESQIKTKSPHYAALTQLHSLSLQEIQQQALDDDALLLEYSLGEDKSFLWAVTKSGVASYELPRRSEAEALANQVRDVVTAARFIEGESFEQRQVRLNEFESRYWQSASALSKMLLGPAAAQLEKKQLIIVADGALQYIPFGALPDPQSTDDTAVPLMVDHQVTHQPSASTLATLRNKIKGRPPASNVLAVFADPVFEWDDSRLSAAKETIAGDPHEQGRGEAYRALRDAGAVGDGQRIPRLFASRDEANSIMSVTPSKLSLKAIGFEANKGLATGPELSRYRIIHFATHGVLDNETPELSGLVLSLFDKDGQPQDGFLRLNDIYNLDLPADLVVLSACNSALGKPIKGEGLIGLTRGFMYAGAARVMASLWKVDDEATAELIKHFYQEMLAEKKSPAEALRQAQMTMWRQKRWRSPYFWAAFVLQGEYNTEIDAGQSPQRADYYLAILTAVFAAILVVSLFAARRIVIKKQRAA